MPCGGATLHPQSGLPLRADFAECNFYAEYAAAKNGANPASRQRCDNSTQLSAWDLYGGQFLGGFSFPMLVATAKFGEQNSCPAIGRVCWVARCAVARSARRERAHRYFCGT
jgi:hypothetical protein